MKKLNTRLILTLSIAIFSMFFGAGNTIYPIALAIHAKSQFNWAFVGFITTAIIGPLLGLIGGALFKGKPLFFFGKAGKYPGGLLLWASLALLGPFAVLPRCISVSFASMRTLFPNLSLAFFTLLFCLLAALCLFKRRMLLAILGYVLSPALIFCLGLIIFKGMGVSQVIQPTSLTPVSAVSFGLVTGYQTMDLIASIIFSAGIWSMVSESLSSSSKDVLKGTLITGAIACFLLALIYYGLGHCAAIHAEALQGLSKQQLMPTLAKLTLGGGSAALVNILIALACFTTVIGLIMTISNILSNDITHGKWSYLHSVIGMLILTLIMTSIGFETISTIIIQVMTYLYPLIIVLTLVNIGTVLFKMVRKASDVT
jgi:LIVCS family branched-chain amino acid:cation transporter